MAILSPLGVFGEWLGDSAFGHLFKQIFAESIEMLGVGALAAGLLATWLGYSAWRVVWAVVTPAPESDWASLNPDDPAMMEKAAKDYNVLVSLAAKLDEGMAETPAELADQLRRLGRYGQHTVWDKIQLDNDEIMRALFERPGVAKGVAHQLRKNEARSLEEFRNQIRILQSRSLAQ